MHTHHATALVQVKVVSNQVTISCEHEERSNEMGSVKRQIYRAYKLPDDVDASKLKSNLSARGLLTITAPKK